MRSPGFGDPSAHPGAAGADRLERLGRTSYERLRPEFSQIAAENSARCVLIDAAPSRTPSDMRVEQQCVCHRAISRPISAFGSMSRAGAIKSASRAD
jgi:hypothetical protein